MYNSPIPIYERGELTIVCADVLGKQVAKLIPQSTLVEFPGMGHAPQMEEPAKFHQALLAWLDKTHPVR